MAATSGNTVLKGFLDYIGNHLAHLAGGAAAAAVLSFVTIITANKAELRATEPTNSGATPSPATMRAPSPPIHLRVTATQQSAQNMAATLTESLTTELQRQTNASQARIDLNIDNVRSGSGATKLVSINWSIGLKDAAPIHCQASGISYLRTSELSQKISTRIIRSLDELETGRGMTCS